MTLPRIVPVLLIKNGKLVRSSNFTDHRVVGDPFLQCSRFNAWDIDEIIYLDINRELGQVPLVRNDRKNQSVIDINEIQKFVAEVCQVPLAWGGNLRSLRFLSILGPNQFLWILRIGLKEQKNLAQARYSFIQ